MITPLLCDTMTIDTLITPTHFLTFTQEEIFKDSVAFVSTARTNRLSIAPAVNALQALLELPSYFGHFRPIATSDGRIVVHPAEYGGFLINAGGNVGMAWELLKNLLHSVITDSPALCEVRPSSYYSFMLIPILRAGLEDYLQVFFNDTFRREAAGQAFFQHWYTPAFASRQEMIDDAVNRLMIYLDMPLAVTTKMPEELFLEEINAMLMGDITPEETAIRVQQNIDIWHLQ